MRFRDKLIRPPWRTLVPACCLLLVIFLGYLVWSPGLDVLDGRDDRGHNGIWLSHGWLGGDDWFVKNGKTNEVSKYRDPLEIRRLAERLARHHISDVFPHLCPAQPDGSLASVDGKQVERFLDEFQGIRVIPWIGGPNGENVRLNDSIWRAAFVRNVESLLTAHPRLGGVQVNIEPLASGDTNFLKLLEELRVVLPKDKILSVAAYPPPTRWHPHPDVHWEESYFRQVARRADQMAVMMYDAGQRFAKVYQHLMADWAQEAIVWSEGTPVLLGLPTYDDAGVGYHNPKVENIKNALSGIHRGLSLGALATNYQGVAIYCEWETSDADWEYFRGHFLNQRGREQ